MEGSRIVLITGGNSGLGFETIKSLLRSEHRYQILLGSRVIKKGQDAIYSLLSEFSSSISSIELIQVDIEDDESILNVFTQVEERHGRIDILVNNAGAMLDYECQRGKVSTREAWNRDYNVNVTGTQLLTDTLIPLLLKSKDPRLLFITSGLSTIEGIGGEYDPLPSSIPAGWPKKPAQPLLAYRSSKTALNMVMVIWNTILKKDGVKVWCVSPGFLATNISGNVEEFRSMGARHPSIGADFVRRVIEGQRDRDVGRVVNEYGVQPW